jgi:MSHA pilin protein MshC
MKLWAGFTLIELVMTIVIVGILAAVAAPRFYNNNVFQSRGFADQVQASLRYAQKEAIAQHRNVCVTFTLPAPSTITLRIASLSGAAKPCDSPLTSPTGGSYVITAPAGIAFAALPTAFNFDALGRPNPSALPPISITGATNSITIEAETGYVHSP